MFCDQTSLETLLDEKTVREERIELKSKLIATI